MPLAPSVARAPLAPPTEGDAERAPAEGSPAVARIAASIALAACLLVVAYPIVRAIQLGTSWLGAFEESFGYRYFYGLRWLYLADQELWLPQGQLAGVVHHAINLALSAAGLAPFDEDVFFLRANIFHYAAVAIPALLTVGALALVLSMASRGPGRPLLAVLLLLPIFGWENRGIDNSMRPDYHGFIYPIYLLATAAAIRIVDGRRPVTWRFAVLVGVLCGCALMLKPTFLPLPITLGLLLLTTRRLDRAHLARVAIVPPVAFATLVVVFALQYLRSISQYPKLLSNVFDFVQSVAGTDKVPYADWFVAQVTTESYVLRVTLCLPILVPLLYLAGGSRRWLRMLVALAPGLAFYAYYVYARWERVTYLEATSFGVLCLTLLVADLDRHALLRRLIPTRPILRRLSTIAGLAVLAGAVPYFLVAGEVYVQSGQRGSDFTKRAWAYVQGLPGRQLFMIPNVAYHPPSVDPAIFKGGWEGWDYRTGAYANERLFEMFPRRDFISAATTRDATLDLDDYDALLIYLSDPTKVDTIVETIGRLYPVAPNRPRNMRRWAVAEMMPQVGADFGRIVVIRRPDRPVSR